MQLAQGLCACGLVGGGFGRDGAALPGADVEPRLEGDARENAAGAARYSVVKLACEPARSFVQPPPDDRDDVALFGRGDVALRDALRREILPVGEGQRDGLRGVISVFMVVVIEMIFE
ncbi:MAG: hypothetical protein ACLRMJ_09295 [Alistipes finegoldii]